MAEQDTAVNINISAATAAKPPAAAQAVIKKKTYVFERALLYVVLLIALAGGYESFTEKSYPGLSILSLLHSYGYLKEYPIIYEPSKGIWRLMGWAGSSMMAVMMLYSIRKRVGAFSSFGSMRHWLHAHMFLGIVGPLLITLHTTFKFGGLIATSFWCMVVTVVFGILGRYIYVQIPRSINGTELGVKEIEKEVEELDGKLGASLTRAHLSNLLGELGVRDKSRLLKIVERERPEETKNSNHLSALLEEIQATAASKYENTLLALLFMFKTDIMNIFRLRSLKRILRTRFNLDKAKTDEVISVLKKKAELIRRKNFLFTSHRLLHHWHVLHIPLAIVMFLIMFLHIAVYYIFRSGF